MGAIVLAHRLLVRQAAVAAHLRLAVTAQAPLLETVATEQRPLFLAHP